MTKIALIGAGGKMGLRLSRNLKGSAYETRHVEISEAGRAALAALRRLIARVTAMAIATQSNHDSRSAGVREARK